MQDYTEDYLLDRQIKIFQPVNGYRASTDAIMVSSLVNKVKDGDTILDVGSGTGAISLCLASRFRYKKIQIIGLELQSELAELSNLSSKANGFDEFLHYINYDIRGSQNTVKANSFQHVISNPPYTDHDMPSPNIAKATAHNHSDFNLTEWITFCLRMLQPQGMFYMINRAEAINEILNSLYGKAGNIKIIPLFTKALNKAKRVMIIAQKSSKTPTEILPQFIVHNEDGYTAKAHNILREGKSFFDYEP